MPKLKKQLPSYALHKASGQAIVKFGGKTHYLGPHGSKKSREEYGRKIAEYLAALDPTIATATPQERAEMTVVEMLAMFRRWATKHYRKNGRQTGEAAQFDYAMRPLKMLYGRELVRDFGPLKLKAIQAFLVKGYTDAKGDTIEGVSRNTANSRIGRIKRIFAWAVGEEMAPASLSHALSEVHGLQRGRTDARETEPVGPVDDSTVEATIAKLPAVLADMVKLQRLLGCRPGEVCALKPENIDRTGEVWRFTPEAHKTEHHGHDRTIYIGPKAQAILTPYLLRSSKAYCFAPADSERKRHDKKRAERKSPVQPSQQNRRSRRPRRHKDRYDKDSYRKAIARAAEQAGVDPWGPNRLRHTAATEIRQRFGLEAAQVILGHSRADITQVYAARDTALGVEVVRQIG